MWVRAAIALLAIAGFGSFFLLAFPWNVFVSAVLLCASLVSAIVAFAKDKTVGGALVIVVPSLLATGTFFGNFTTFGIALGWVKPIYGLKIDPSDITLNNKSRVTLIASYANGTTPNLDGYQCHWAFDPSPPVAPGDGKCAIDITDTQYLFKDKASASFTLTIKAEPTPPGSTKPVPLDPTRMYALTLYNYVAPKIDITPSTVELGQPATAKISFPESIAPTDRSCSWTPTDQFQNPNDCEPTFVAPRSTGLYPDGTVPVQVTVTTSGLKLVSDIFRVTVHYPPAKLFDFVLDATTNMKTVSDGITLFDHARDNINSQIIGLEPAGGTTPFIPSQGSTQRMPTRRLINCAWPAKSPHWLKPSIPPSNSTPV